jgi:hypothetical protein
LIAIKPSRSAGHLGRAGEKHGNKEIMDEPGNQSVLASVRPAEAVSGVFIAATKTSRLAGSDVRSFFQ